MTRRSKNGISKALVDEEERGFLLRIKLENSQTVAVTASMLCKPERCLSVRDLMIWKWTKLQPQRREGSGSKQPANWGRPGDEGGLTDGRFPLEESPRLWASESGLSLTHLCFDQGWGHPAWTPSVLALPALSASQLDRKPETIGGTQ